MKEKTFMRYLWTKANKAYALIGTTISIFPGILHSTHFTIIGILFTFLIVAVFSMKSMYQDFEVINGKYNKINTRNEEISKEYNELSIKHQNHIAVYASTQKENENFKMVIHVLRTELYGVNERKTKEANEIVGKLKFALEHMDKGGKRDGI